MTNNVTSDATSTSPFDTLTSRSTTLGAEISKLGAQRRQVDAELCNLLRERLKLHRELFKPLVPDYHSQYDSVDDRGFLEYWEIDEDDFIGEVAYGSRGVACSDRFRVPVRYMAADGAEVLRAEAAALSRQMTEDAATAKRAKDLADIARLKREYPEAL